MPRERLLRRIVIAVLLLLGVYAAFLINGALGLVAVVLVVGVAWSWVRRHDRLKHGRKSH